MYYIFNGYPKKKGCMIVRGRPKKEDSRNKQYRVRLNEQEDRMLTYASALVGKQKSEIFRRALEDYYNKIRINECIMKEEECDWEMDHISLKRVVDCPYCGKGNRIDFENECESCSEERQMGVEITYSFEMDNYECRVCGRKLYVSGCICEYPVGVYSYDHIKIECNDE